nr:unnamed protein product [Callosobruchus chinensis]
MKTVINIFNYIYIRAK